MKFNHKALSIFLLADVLIIVFLIGLWQTGKLDFSKFNDGQPTPNNPSVFEELDKKSGELINKNNKKLGVEIIAEGLDVPWSLVFTDVGRMLFTERNGAVRVINNGKLFDEPIYTVENIYAQGEGGLMGMTLDPNYQENQLLYLSGSYWKDGVATLKVLKMKDLGENLEEVAVILDDVQVAQYHLGSRLKFGPDQKLYISIGDGLQKDQAQNLESNLGKLLRINSDGTIPEDNPWANSAIWAYGLRNSQGFDWHPQTGYLYLSDHGPSGMDGPLGGDEINLIEKGGNYGWPIASHQNSQEGTTDPLAVFTPAIAPSGAAFVDSQQYSETLNGSFLVAMLRGEGIMKLKFDPSNPSQIIEQEKLNLGDLGRIREIISSPAFEDEAAGAEIYFTTSNQDGRGKDRGNDDKIYRLIEE